eukprot:scaffold45407_cov24-Phaeocystis_antarctica.AAC.1
MHVRVLLQPLHQREGRHLEVGQPEEHQAPPHALASAAAIAAAAVFRLGSKAATATLRRLSPAARSRPWALQRQDGPVGDRHYHSIRR